MTISREAISWKTKLQSLLFHTFTRCHLCEKSIRHDDHVEWDHYLPVALGGPHDFMNICIVHAVCHRAKTSGTKATSVGSDIHKIAKDKRIRQGKMAVKKGAKKKLTAWTKRVRAWPKRTFGK